MCVIVYKPSGIMPDEQRLRRCFSANPDGAGFMFPRSGKVQIEKGFQTWAEFAQEFKKLKKSENIKKIPIIFHFRIATQGKVDSGNCHPFPITDQEDMLRSIRCSAPLALAHNGIIPFCTGAEFSEKYKKLSDTQIFIKDYLFPIYKKYPEFYKLKEMRQLINEATKSKFAIMDGRGEVETIGHFIKDNGIYYSNNSYSSYHYYYFNNDVWEDYNQYYVQKTNEKEYKENKQKIDKIIDNNTTKLLSCKQCGKYWKNCSCNRMKTILMNCLNVSEIKFLLYNYLVYNTDLYNYFKDFIESYETLDF